MKPPICRPGEAGDVEALLRLERGFPGDRLNRRSLRRLLASPAAEVWVADDGARPVGDAVVLYRAGSRHARLYSLIVDPAARGRGIGGMLLETAAGAARRRGCERLSLEVRSDNAAAIALYRRHGFGAVRLTPGYYEDGVAALRMRLRLAAPPEAIEPLSRVA